MCSTGLEDNPEAAVHLSSLNQWLFFAASQVNAIYTQLPSGRFHDRNPLYVCTVRNNCESSYFQHMISSGANHSSTGSEASGSGATTLNDCNQLNSQICTLFVARNSKSSSLTMHDAVSHN